MIISVQHSSEQGVHDVMVVKGGFTPIFMHEYHKIKKIALGIALRSKYEMYTCP